MNPSFIATLSRSSMLLISACVSLWGLLLSGCPAPTQPPVQTLELSADYIGAKEVWLGVRLLDSSQPRTVVIKRNENVIYSNQDAAAEILFVDSLLAPKQTYSYRAERPGKENDLPVTINITTLDTTSHAVSWTVDTLGAQGLIRDVWAFDQNNIWAVGEIYLRDSTGQIDMSNLYNVARWDRNGWTLSKGAPVSFNTIFAFSSTDVWAGTSAPYHWDGTSWRGFNVTGIFNGTITEIWGTNSSNVYIVGTNGSIAHYNGTTWRKMESGTTVDLEDVWGIDEKHIWATGTSTQIGRSVILFFDGTRWSTLYDTETQPISSRFGYSSVWSNSSKVLHLAGQGGVRWFHQPTRTFKRQQTGQRYISYHLHATLQNDIFVVGGAGEAAHFNGASWYLYPELKNDTEFSFSIFLTVQMRPRFVAIGGLIFTGLNGFPVVVRGYR